MLAAVCYIDTNHQMDRCNVRIVGLALPTGAVRCGRTLQPGLAVRLSLCRRPDQPARWNFD